MFKKDSEEMKLKEAERHSWGNEAALHHIKQVATPGSKVV